MSDIMVDRYYAEDANKAPVVTPDATTAANAVSSNGEVNVKKSSSGSHTSFSSMNDLQKKEPEFYDLMMQGSLISFIKRQESSNDRMKAIIRETYQK